jgi:AraC family transcriptional activator FtrA
MPSTHRVAVLAYPGGSGFETAVVAEVFGLARPELGPPRYSLAVCAERAGPVPLLGGAQLVARYGLRTLAAADTVVVPGVPDVHGDPSPALVAALRRAHRRGARIVSICSGAFALAGAGLLDGRRAATHWRYAELLAERYPAVEVDAGVLYVDDGGNVLTSAGSAAGLDLCLHLVRRDCGPAYANEVARRLVVPPHREGGQAQFVPAPVAVGRTGDDPIAETMAWALGRLAEPMEVDDLARHANLAPRTFLRNFARASGTSPMRWLIGQRVQASLPLLAGSALSVEQVAAAVGFASPVTYRHHFTRAMHTSPSAYRKAFQT